MKKRIEKYFPMDFYGDFRGWRFIVRAEHADEVVAALMWRAYICVHRKEFNLFEIATETFPYQYNYYAHECYIENTSTHIKMLGPIVSVRKLNQMMQPQNEKVMVP